MFGWTTDQTWTFIVLLFPTITSVLIPVMYLPRANLRDPLARAMAAVSVVVALTFLLRCSISVMTYSGVSPGLDSWHWSSRMVYFAVGVAQTLFFIAMLPILRGAPKNQLLGKEREDA